MSTRPSASLLGRIAALAVALVFFQIGVVSEVPVFGVNIDLSPLLVGAAASAASTAGYSLVEFLLGVDAPVSLELLRQIVVGVFVNSVVALPTWALVRRALEAGLPEDPRRRRRRAYTTGGLSPLSRA